ncbi:MAG: T9SS type A sorting domain-containing protein [Lewinellaceae bacterium]|nr:T9SS type A sorting domain-containing protein [Lewinellaceae bacterium]
MNNPHLTPANGSLKVGKYNDPAGQAYAGIGTELAAAPDLAVYNQLQMQVWSPNANIPVLIKMEGGNPQIEIWDTIRVANAWYKLNADFSSHVGTNNFKIVIFIDAGNDAGGGVTYFIDNLRWSRAGYNGCIDDHETAASTISNFKYFANGSLEAQGYQFEVVSNPNPSGINMSSKVGKFVKAGDGAPFAGMYADLEAPIDWKGVKQARAKVHMDHIGNFTIKLEGDAINNYSIENPVVNTEVNSWEELTYNFDVVPDNSEFKRITVFFDLTIDATGTDVTSYFDDIVIGNGECGSVSVFNPLPVEPMVVAPNPVSNELMVENFRDITRLEVYNLFGQRVSAINTGGDLRTYLDVSRFPAGVYVLTGFNAQGVLVGNAKFVKQ